MPLFLDCLLYFTSFGAILILFGSAVSLLIWLLKAFVLWATNEPEPETGTGKSRRFRPQDLDYLKRAGQ